MKRAGRRRELGRLHQRVGQVILQMREFARDPGPQRGVCARAELLERQSARDHVLPKRGERLLAIGVRRAQRRIIHDCTLDH